MNFSWVKDYIYKRQYYERKKRNSVIVSRIMETEGKKENKERYSIYLREERARYKMRSYSESNNGKRNF